MSGFEGKVAVVTGGASGIGRATALRLAERGCDVAVFDAEAQGARSCAAKIESLGRRSVVATGDVANRADVDAAAAVFRRELGVADILVNCAGIVRVATLLEQDYEEFADLFRVNVDGTFHFCQAVVPAMVERGSGSVVNMASWLGKKGMSHYGGYAASKFAVIGITQTLALEVARSGVRVNCVCPGTIVETGMREEAEAAHRRIGFPSAEERLVNIPLGRLGKPDDVARVACFLASDEADYMTGQSINVTGGHWLN